MGRPPIQHWRCPHHVRDIALDRYVRLQLRELSWRQARGLIASGKISINGAAVRTLTTRVQPGDLVVFNPEVSEDTATRRKHVPILYFDSQIVVVNKPAGISTVPFDKNERGTLSELVRKSLRGSERHRQPTLHVVHRIDKTTSGVILFARTRTAHLRMKQMFRVHDIERRYLALVHGCPRDRTFCSQLVADRGDGKRGSTFNPRLGRRAVTHTRVLERFKSFALIECRLETGRTHQIRIQLAEAGFPLLGERVYARSTPDVVAVPRLMLHAAYLAFRHPLTDMPLEYSVDAPDDMATTIKRLRNS